MCKVNFGRGQKGVVSEGKDCENGGWIGSSPVIMRVMI